MINYRVDDLVGFLEQLQAREVATSPVEEHNDGRYPDSKGKGHGVGCSLGAEILLN